MSVSEVLLLDKRDDGVALLTLNRPDRRNALSAALRNDLVDCLQQLTDDQSIQAVLLTGAGDIFCAGFDLNELKTGDAKAIFAQAHSYHRAVHSFSKPLIAAINGPALAGGMDLASMCDIRLGCAQSGFGQPQVRMGIPAAFELVRSVTDESTARYLCLTGDVISASAALNCGILSAIYDSDQLHSKALECAVQVAAGNAGELMKARFVARQPTLYD
jgi:enoyl-CoA hydratase